MSSTPQDASPSRNDAEMPAEVRREHMLALLQVREFVRVADLSARFGVSEVTVRSDLDALAERGHIRRVRGGAMPRTPIRPERRFEETQSSHAAEKAAIGRAAARLVSSGETVILDVGTTTTAVARALIARDDLHDVVVFTNALNIAIELESVAPRVSVVVTGGTLRPMQHSLVDPLGRMIIERINVNIAFIGCNGIEPDYGITNINLPEAEIKRSMLHAAQQRVVVTDGSKLGEVALAYLCGVNEVDTLITGVSADPDIVARLRERKLDVVIAT